MTHVLDALGRIKEYWGSVALADLDDYAVGALVHGGLADWGALAPGAINQVLVAKGAGNQLVWEDTTSGSGASQVVRTDGNSGIRPSRLGIGAAVPGAAGQMQGYSTTVPQALLEIAAASDNTVLEALRIQRRCNAGAGADGIGVSMIFYAETETNAVYEPVGLIQAWTTDATAGTVDSSMKLGVYQDGALIDAVVLATDGAITVGGPSLTVPDGWQLGQAAGPLVTFDDTNDELEMTGCFLSLDSGALAQVDPLKSGFRVTAQRAGTIWMFIGRHESAGGGATANGFAAGLLFQGYDGANYQQLAAISANADGQAVAAGDSPGRLVFFTTPDGSGAITTRMTITEAGDLLLGTLVRPNGGTYGKVMVFGDNGGDPNLGNNTAAFYGKSVAGNVEAFATNEDESTRAQLTPHNFTLFSPDPSHLCPWSHYAIHPHIGYEIGVDMYGAVKAIEQLVGKQFIHERELAAEQKLDWNIQQEIKKRQQDALRLAEAMLEEVEVGKLEALEYIEETEGIPTGKMIKTGRYKLVGDEVVEIEEPEMKDVPTGRMIWQLKAEARFNAEDGAFYRTKTEQEAEFEEYIVKQPPAWLKERMPDGTIN